MNLGGQNATRSSSSPAKAHPESSGGEESARGHSVQSGSTSTSEKASQDVGSSSGSHLGGPLGAEEATTSGRVFSEGQGQGQSESVLKGRTVVVIGAGGAGRALAFGAAHKGAKVIIANR